jgi:hypothetical protein
MSNFPSTFIPLSTSTSLRTNKIVDEYLTPKLIGFRQIEVSDEPLTIMTDRVTWKTLWGNILPDAPIVITRAGERLMPVQFETDNTLGRITFKDLNVNNQIIGNNGIMIDMTGRDGRQTIEVTGNYMFDYFPFDVLKSFVVSSLNIVNTAGNEAGSTFYTIDSCPSNWDGVITDLAFAQCMERLLLDYDMWKGRLIFAIGADSILEGQGGDISSQLQTLKQNAEERAYKTIDNPKFKAGYYTSMPTANYWRAINTPGMSGSQDVYTSGRLRGYRPNRIGR